jgi:hypothetical protein
MSIWRNTNRGALATYDAARCLFGSDGRVVGLPIPILLDDYELHRHSRHPVVGWTPRHEPSTPSHKPRSLGIILTGPSHR